MDTKTIRENVSQAYARALVAEDGAGCCGNQPKGRLAQRAGYAQEELVAIPQDAASNSFGCGNPLAFSEVREGETVLDLGCGAGIDVLLGAMKVGATGRVIGVDMTEEMIERARRNVADARLMNAEIRKGIIEELPVETGSIDWLISNCVINLSPEKPRVFKEIARVLKPGGRMMVSDVIAEGLPPEVLSDLRMYSCCVAGALSEGDYREGLRLAGLTDIMIEKTMEMDISMLDGLIESDRVAGCGCTGHEVTSDHAALAKACAGKVWSTQISARKPR